MHQAEHTIAVLDDEEEYRKALSRLLTAHGYQVEAFASGEALLAAMATARFACVLLDLNMPEMSGFDVLAALQGKQAVPPVIVLTASDDADMRRLAFGHNAFDYRLKPVSSAVLLGAIAQALRVGERGHVAP